MTKTSALDIIETLFSMQNENKSRIYQHFFKTGEGQYGYGDKFLGVVNPEVRNVVKQVADIETSEIKKLLENEWHEIRLCGLLLLVKKYEKLSKSKFVNDYESIKKRDEIIVFYLDNSARANNWDLVDLSVIKIIGRWLLQPTFLGSEGDKPDMNFDYKQKTLDSLAKSENIWQQRMSIVSTWQTSHQGVAWWCLRYSEMLLEHPHDLIHKAVGWMLREMGKHCGVDILCDFLDKHYTSLNRTTLRYAIEKFDAYERTLWLKRVK